MKIGERIKKRRTQLKMSVDELARRIGKDRSTIYRYESGGIDKVSIDILKPLSDALETTPAYLIGADYPSMEFSTAHMETGGTTATYISTSTVHVRHMERFVKELGHVEMTDDENEEIIKFAKYLIYKRTISDQ